MKTLILTIVLTSITCGPALAWDDFDMQRETIQQAEERNYRNHMRAIQEEMLWLEQQEHDMRMREYWERQNSDY